MVGFMCGLTTSGIIVRQRTTIIWASYVIRKSRVGNNADTKVRRIGDHTRHLKQNSTLVRGTQMYYGIIEIWTLGLALRWLNSGFRDTRVHQHGEVPAEISTRVILLASICISERIKHIISHV
ncbi:Protein of unknown function [Pyronema omphalodes CBS 100304]|uniref:Uncharacterized protein n=1 Tax=Pyronema omphalodes (strain CBS 100304) TaxID=1076935 RepID=U4LSH4_PYROM|nr:Protein of unknown function [Pyronema omphalodes CBS 100304]